MNRKMSDSVYGTHICPLLTAVLHTKGDVLEMGTGDFSTPLLHSLCLQQKRNLHSTDTDKEWLKLFLDLQSPTHTFQFVPVYESVIPNHHCWDSVGNQKWGVVFIDHRPGERRAVDIVRFRNDAEIIVVHDTETPSYGYEQAFQYFKYRYDYKRYSVWTTLVSNTVDVQRLFETP